MSIRVTWLGQSGLLFHGAGTTVLVDPWISPHPHRAVPPPEIAWPVRIDLLLITHGHGDHLDPDGLREIAKHSAIGEIVAPEPHLTRLSEILPDVPRLGVRPGIAVARLGVMEVFPAWHGVVATDGYSPMIAADGTAPHVGFAFVLGDTRIYVSGDTIPDAALVEAVAPFRPHLACLPVNGRDAEREARGLLGNLDSQEAVDFAVSIRAEALLPLHHDGITGNTSDVGAVARAAVDRPIRVLLPARGLPFSFSGTRP